MLIEQLESQSTELDELRDHYVRLNGVHKQLLKGDPAVAAQHKAEKDKLASSVAKLQAERLQLQRDLSELQRRHDTQRASFQTLETQLRVANATLLSRNTSPEASVPTQRRVTHDDPDSEAASLSQQLREQAEVNARLKALLVAVGVSGGVAPSASASSLQVDELASMTQQRVQQDMEMEKELERIRERSDRVDQLIEERDAWKSSTRKLEEMVLTLSKECQALRAQQ